ncbi:MAG: phosphatidylserine/phosphatidylglycerophosphate/cardiolipin synthase-like enzyme, partial [Sulfurimonas sp.]|uniref:restriction endonuclease PLD domain-containing protein n=1 Tax=Sulfurimonas sp. TaxID=2022749 RepID=UPI0039E39F90
MYETIFTNTKDYGNTFLKEFTSKLDSSNDLIIASGYIGATTIEDLENKMVSLSKKGNCKILIGMIFHGGVTAKQKKVLASLDDKLRVINPDNGVYISMQQYHGKIYKFMNEDTSYLYLGSSNFSKEGFASRLECTTIIKDNQTKTEVALYLEHLFSLKTTVPLKKAELRVNGKKKIILK